jgi:hypothetical protein
VNRDLPSGCAPPGGLPKVLDGEDPLAPEREVFAVTALPLVDGPDGDVVLAHQPRHLLGQPVVVESGLTGTMPRDPRLAALLSRLPRSRARRTGIEAGPARRPVIAVISCPDEVRSMADVLIRDLPDDVLAAIDANARRLGLSRNEYLRRQLAGERHTRRDKVTVEHLRRTADVFADIDDPDVMAGAWS